MASCQVRCPQQAMECIRDKLVKSCEANQRVPRTSRYQWEGYFDREDGVQPLPWAVQTVDHALVNVIFVYQVAQAHFGCGCLLTLCRRYAGLTNGG